jgi:hypothetical protein
MSEWANRPTQAEGLPGGVRVHAADDRRVGASRRAVTSARLAVWEPCGATSVG